MLLKGPQPMKFVWGGESSTAAKTKQTVTKCAVTRWMWSEIGKLAAKDDSWQGRNQGSTGDVAR